MKNRINRVVDRYLESKEQPKEKVQDLLGEVYKASTDVEAVYKYYVKIQEAIDSLYGSESPVGKQFDIAFSSLRKTEEEFNKLFTLINRGANDEEGL